MERFMVMVDYAIPTFEELKPRFDDVSDTLNGAKFRQYPSGAESPVMDREVSLEYFHPNRALPTPGVLVEMDRAGLRPALYQELLAFSAQYPDEQRRFPIIALGSFTYVKGFCDVARVDFSSYPKPKRGLWLASANNGHIWLEHCRFLAAREQPVAA